MDISVHITVALIRMETKIRRFNSRPCEDARDREYCRPLGRPLRWPVLLDSKDIVKMAVLSGRLCLVTKYLLTRRSAFHFYWSSPSNSLPFLFLFDFSLLRRRLT